MVTASVPGRGSDIHLFWSLPRSPHERGFSLDCSFSPNAMQPCSTFRNEGPTFGFVPMGVAQSNRMFEPWWRLSLDATMLAVEAQGVIAMRLTSAALGRGTHAENTLMVTEKAPAFLEAAAVIASGGSPNKVVRGYRKHVRANARRLRRAR
jgi:hypothetical protein